GVVSQPSTGTSQAPRLRSPARSTRACWWNARSPTYAVGRLGAKPVEEPPPSTVWYTPSCADPQARLLFQGSSAIAVIGRFGSAAVRSAQLPPPSVLRNTRPPPTVE